VIDETHLKYILQLIEGTTVQHIIVIGDSKEYKEKSAYYGVQILSLVELQQIGLEHPAEKERSSHITFDTIASIYYSSNPKNNVNEERIIK
jgi:orotate phosphoribosyltransferase